MTQVTDHRDADEEPEQDTGDRADADERAHLDGVDDGCGCAEVWEHLSDQRASEVSD